jgi:UDP-glucose 4-epimerase
MEGRRAGDPARLVAQADKAHRVLGWTPRHPNLEDIVRSAWSWRSQQADRLAARLPRP